MGQDTLCIFEQIKMLVKNIGKCVILLLDKNKHCPIIVCGRLFWLKIFETYVHDDFHCYILSNISEAELLKLYVE